MCGGVGTPHSTIIPHMHGDSTVLCLTLLSAQELKYKILIKHRKVPQEESVRHEMQKKLSWLSTGEKKQRAEDGGEVGSIPRWICMVMRDSKDNATCNDTRLSQSLDLSLLLKEEGNATEEDMGNSQTDQISPHSKISMMKRFRNRSHSVQPDNFLAVDKLMSRRRSDSTAHKSAIDVKGLTSSKNSVFSESSTGTTQRGSETSETSTLAPLSPYVVTRGYSEVGVLSA